MPCGLGNNILSQLPRQAAMKARPVGTKGKPVREASSTADLETAARTTGTIRGNDGRPCIYKPCP